MSYIRPIAPVVLKRLQEKRKHIQVLSGPRQTGKSTVALEVQQNVKNPVRFVSADEPTIHGLAWLAQQWELSRLDSISSKKTGSLLIVDEIQKVGNWSETVKRLWDEDTRTGVDLKVLILGSSPWLLQRSLTESLAGRFEFHYSPHWSFIEMKQAFGWNLDQYLFYGGYPGAAGLINDYRRWIDYIQHSLIETTLAKDILLLTRIDRLALLRQLFALGCEYSGQILSYQKMLGQLHDAGNTTTLAHYLELLDAAGMISGLQKFALAGVRQRGIEAQERHFTHSQSVMQFTNLRDNIGYICSAGPIPMNRNNLRPLFVWKNHLKSLSYPLNRNSANSCPTFGKHHCIKHVRCAFLSREIIFT